MRPALACTGLFALAFLAAGCPPAIGDSCGSSIDCSVNGDRLCDQSAPAGYCTVEACEADTCPEDAVCVRFRPEPERLARSACMKPCESDGDCRQEEGYACVSAAELGCFVVEEALPRRPVAEVLDEDRPDRSFCAAAASWLFTPQPCM
jgi:hypothetical protein